jgi:hypothetical protein
MAGASSSVIGANPPEIIIITINIRIGIERKEQIMMHFRSNRAPVVFVFRALLTGSKNNVIFDQSNANPVFCGVRGTLFSIP